MTQELAANTHSAATSSCDDEELSSLLNPGKPTFEADQDPLNVEIACFPLDGVMDVVDAPSARAPGVVDQGFLGAPAESIRARSTSLARDVLARAEQDVRELLTQNLLATDRAARTAAIVARAQRDVREILTRGRAPAAPCFATLRALALPAPDSELRYQLSGRLTLAALLAFRQAVSRLPGVTSATVEPQPEDVTVLSVTTSDSRLVHRLLACMPGIDLRMDPS